jgi:hypothetical protein
MTPLYAARIADFRPGDFVQVDCACGHVELLTARMLATAGIAPDRAVQQISPAQRRGKKLPVVVAAIAREMAAFLWAIGREVTPV